MANTPNLGLHQWAAGDSFLRTDFNSDFSKIDAGVPKMVSGSFVGNGIANRKVVLGFRPRLLVLMGYYYDNCGLTVFTPEGMACAILNYSASRPTYSEFLTLTDNGFTLSQSYFMNANNTTTTYFAIG